MGTCFHFETSDCVLSHSINYLVKSQIRFGPQISVESISSGHAKFTENINEQRPRIQHKIYMLVDVEDWNAN